MTQEPAKPLTADEIADLKIFVQRSSHIWPKYLCRTMPSVIATIEQQAGQVEKLRGTLKHLRGRLADERIGTINYMESSQIYADFRIAVALADEALAATELVNDKR